MLPHLWGDVCHAARRLAASPGFTAAAVLTIALGVGINTSLFSVLNALILRDLPAPDAEQLLSIHQRVEGRATLRSEGAGTFSTEEYRTYRDRTRTLSGVIGYSATATVTLGGDVPQAIEGTFVTCDYFDVLLQPPALGPGLRAEHCAAGAAPVVVLGHELWQNVFDADPDIVGRELVLNRQSVTVVGVAPMGARGLEIAPVSWFAPIAVQPLLRADFDLFSEASAVWLTLIGRKSGETSLAQVRAELEVVAAQLDAEQPPRATTLHIARASFSSNPERRPTQLAIGLVVMAASGFVLLIACANVANLLLARSTGRTRELAVRLSLGASRRRIMQPLLAESLLIGAAGGLVGSALAVWSSRGLFALALSSLPPQVPRIAIDAGPDLRVLLFAIALSVATGIGCGLAPALRAGRTDLNTAMKPESVGADGRSGTRLQGVFVGVQVALCIVLMVAAALLLRGLHAAQNAEPGFAYRDVVAASFDLTNSGYEPERAAGFQRQLAERVRALPGVDAVAHAQMTPLQPGGMFIDVTLPGSEQPLRTAFNVVSPGFFSLVDIPVVRGRTFTQADLAEGATAVIVTETTARTFWPAGDPLGKTIAWGPSFSFEVVGVARDAEIADLGTIPSSYLYLPATSLAQLQLLARSRGELGATASAIRAAAADIDPGLVVRAAPLEANLDFYRAVGALVGSLSASLGVLALVLAAIGIYAVVAYAVGRRVREIGIRIALGASARSVGQLILTCTMRPVVVGAVLGLIAALGVSRVLSSVLFGISPADPIAFGAAVLVVVGAAVAAGVFPAKRIARMEPVRSLHYE